jgi:hypothetical protein
MELSEFQWTSFFSVLYFFAMHRLLELMIVLILLNLAGASCFEERHPVAQVWSQRETNLYLLHTIKCKFITAAIVVVFLNTSMYLFMHAS